MKASPQSHSNFVLGLLLALGCAKPETQSKHYWNYWSGPGDIQELFLFPHNSLVRLTSFEREETDYRWIKDDSDWHQFKSLLKDGDELWQWAGGGNLVKIKKEPGFGGAAAVGVCLIRKGKIVAIYCSGVTGVLTDPAPR